MTCCAVIVAAPDRLLAAADGIVRVPGLGDRGCAKIFALPHVPMIVTGRGLVPLHAMVAANFFAATGGLFGQMRVMPAALNDVFPKIAGGFGAEADANDVIFAGWDGARMAIAEFSQRDRVTGFRLEPRAEYYIAPWDAALDHLTRPRDFGELAQLVRAQIDLSRSRDPSIAVGLPILLAELTSARVVFETVAA